MVHVRLIGNAYLIGSETWREKKREQGYVEKEQRSRKNDIYVASYIISKEYIKSTIVHISPVPFPYHTIPWHQAVLDIPIEMASNAPHDSMPELAAGKLVLASNQDQTPCATG